MKLEKVKGFLNRQLRQTFSRVIDFIQLDTAEPGHKDRALLAMMKWALMKGGHIPEEALSELRQLLAKRAETGAEISPQRLASTFNVVFFIFPEIIPKVVCNKWSRVILKLVARDTIWQILCPLLANSNSRLQAASAW